MWSFATHAGAGMAIAGLTATYYALSRRNYQGERERMEHESGFGDGPQVNRLRQHNENGHLTSSHMLLKKELEELSVLNGSGSGLNVLYQQKHPLHRFHKSNFEISPIVSRVDTRPSTVYSPSEEQIGTSHTGGDESVFGSESNLDSKTNTIVPKSIASDELPNLPIDNEEKPSATISEKGGGGDVIDDKNEVWVKENSVVNVDANENEEENVSSAEAKQSETVGEKWKSVEENQFLKRTTSPICFFKNPDFGNRYAVYIKKKKKQSSPLVATLSASNISLRNAGEAEEDPSQDLGETGQGLASTQFILTPALSESNVSICETENPEKMLERRKKAVRTTTSKATIDTKTPVEEMSEYNTILRKKMNSGGKRETRPLIRLRADPEICNLCPPSKRTAIPVRKRTPHKHCGGCQMVNAEHLNKHTETEEKTETSDREEKIDKVEDGDGVKKDKSRESNNNIPFEKADAEFGDLSEEPSIPEEDSSQHSECSVVCSRTSSMVTEIPSDSWISLPIRIYTNSMRTLPWSLIGFCVLVVIIAGVLGVILSKLANSVYRRHTHGGL